MATSDDRAETTQNSHAGVVAPPPLIYVAAFAAVLAGHWLWPVPILDHPAMMWGGVALLLAGVALNVWGAYSLRKARTPINSYRATRTVVSTGAFAVSRNPLYVGLYLVFLGLSAMVNSLWGVVFLVPLLAVMHYGVVRREERHLEAKFGDAYRRYRERVRRY